MKTSHQHITAALDHLRDVDRLALKPGQVELFDRAEVLLAMIECELEGGVADPELAEHAKAAFAMQ